MVAMFNNYPLGFYSAATLVKDAQRHGLHFRPVDVNRSQYLFTTEEADVRVGLKYVKGLREDVAEMIVAERKNGPYQSVDDLVARVPEMNKREVRALSVAGALNFDNTVHRRQALWDSELALQPAGELFESGAEALGGRGGASPHSAVENAPYLKKMEGLQLVEADLRKTGISIGKHPMAFVREKMKQKGILSAMDVPALRRRDIVSVAGAAIIRQRPMTANEVVFMTLEDETGHSNFVVMPDVYERFRFVINQNDFLVIRGIVEDDNMIKALYFEPINEFRVNVVSHNFR